MALEGFVALAPDFLSPLGGTPTDEDKAREMFGQLEPAQAIADGVATVAFLEGPRARQRQGRRRRFLLGRRRGQRPCRHMRRTSPPAVAYYGRQPKAEDVAKIKAPLLLHYAGLDERINAGIDAYKAALTKDGKEFTDLRL